MFTDKEKINKIINNFDKDNKVDREDLFNRHKESIFHMIRCSDMAREFGEFIKLSGKDLDLLEFATLIHDIGKLNIDSKVLYKKDIDNDDFRLIKSHVNYDYKYENKEEEIIINDCIKYHHLRPNNKGYAGGDKSYEDIHYFAKIVSVVDVFDVLTNIRVYKNNKMTIDEAIIEIKANIGTQFEEIISNQFIIYLEEKFNKSLKVV